MEGAAEGKGSPLTTGEQPVLTERSTASTKATAASLPLPFPDASPPAGLPAILGLLGGLVGLAGWLGWLGWLGWRPGRLSTCLPAVYLPALGPTSAVAAVLSLHGMGDGYGDEGAGAGLHTQVPCNKGLRSASQYTHRHDVDVVHCARLAGTVTLIDAVDATALHAVL